MLRYLFLLSFCILLISCSKELTQDSVVGTWELNSISSSGFMSDSIERVETYEDLGGGCGILSTTDITDQIQLTFEVSSCSIITLNEDYTGQITKGQPDEMETIDITYSLDEGDNIVTICPSPGQCVDYTCENDKLSITLPVATIDMMQENYRQTLCYVRR